MNNVLRQKTSNVKVEIAVFPADTKYTAILHPTLTPPAARIAAFDTNGSHPSG
jgi:hypothetical protein